MLGPNETEQVERVDLGCVGRGNGNRGEEARSLLPFEPEEGALVGCYIQRSTRKHIHGLEGCMEEKDKLLK